MYVNSIIKQTTQEFDQNRKIKFTQEKRIVNVNVWTQVSQRLSFQTCQNNLKKKTRMQYGRHGLQKYRLYQNSKFKLFDSNGSLVMTIYTHNVNNI